MGTLIIKLNKTKRSKICEHFGFIDINPNLYQMI